MAVKYNDLCIDIRRQLITAGDGNPMMTAKELVCAASGKTKEQLLADYSLYVPTDVANKALELCARRVAGEPLGYILGEWEFMGMTLTVGPGVLIPRDDTEIAASLAIKAADDMADNDPKVLDLCCGSGCIGLAVAKKVPAARVVMADISDEALAICHKNAADLGLSNRAIHVKADVMQPPPAYLGKFDIIVSNPPYITSADMQTLDRSVKDFEPNIALHGGEDGLDFYRAILKNWVPALKTGGKIIFEMGIGQAEPILEMLRSEGIGVIGIARDSGGIDRAVIAETM